ncbi:MAG: undecaprenyl/decaprenyl-phosphate alpha-N-acetylglucosaminyl 1-phosphate transferase [Salinivirgaceae bacterium]|nr:undecaprenyl/decaprenyl-phosphate alpha-N-acetylglucosaminyl 1-phosphate transferase [Salinivirgaceae bacterium]
MTSTTIFILFFIYTTVFGLFTHRFFVIRAEKYKIKKANTSAERWSSQTKPILGGLSFYVIFLFSIINLMFLFDIESLLKAEVLGSILVITISFLMGLADDMLNTPPGFKFIFQLLCAGILIYSGIYIDIFSTPIYNYILTVFWVVGIMNSINMIDNMDAISSSVAISILIGSTFLMLFTKGFSPFYIILSIGGLAGLVSFLYYNWHPAKMYMGDNGSQFLGALLAIIGIVCFWNAPTMQNHSNLYPFIFAFFAFIVPISDTTTVTINRLLKGQSPFVGGRDHTTHHLSYFGLSERKVAILLFSINLFFVFVAVSIIILAENMIVPIWVFGVLGIMVLLSLYSITKISKPKS